MTSLLRVLLSTCRTWPHQGPFFTTVVSLSDLYYAFWSTVLTFNALQIRAASIVGNHRGGRRTEYHAGYKHGRSKVEVLAMRWLRGKMMMNRQ